ncbi:MAG: hypothetical protein H7062_16570, partial [Candidatus Saccharimonas sp.]|nr:hypothetical protein [Planctomycetaceae bacterium]
LRRRGLYSLAEGYAISRLAQTNLPLAQRTDLAVELSRTLAEHAGFVSDEQQAELWKRASSAVDDERTRDPANPRDALLAVQSAMVPAAEGDWLKVECELRPFDEPLAARTRQACSTAIELLRGLDRQLTEPARDVKNAKKVAEGSPSSHEVRVRLHQVRFQLAVSLRNRSELWPAGSKERSADLLDAEQTFRKLFDVADEPLPFRAKLGFAVCSRLKGSLDRSHEMLTALEKLEPRPADELLDEVVAERARLLLERQQGVDALALIVQTRSKRKRLTGELWLLQVRALASMRDAAMQGKNQPLADQLREQAEITLQRCDEQVGGFWSRRCHVAWESIRTAERYGPALDAAMQQARADFLAGRIEAALKGYADAERSATASGQTDLAIDLGYTRASILLREKQFESAAADFLRLAHEFPKHSRAPAAHLNGAYCLGRLYEEKKTQARREAYTAALDRHVELFESDPTVDDARFFKAQLEEQRLQATAALPLYLQVNGEHPRAAEARAGAARCSEAILVRMRERKLPTGEFEREAIETLSRFAASSSETTAEWTAPQAEVTLHLAALLLLTEPPQFDRAEPLLGSVLSHAGRVTENDEQADRWKRLRPRAAALRVVALAGSGRSLEAERLVKSLATDSPRDLLAIVERLAPFVASDDRQLRQQYFAVQLRAIERLTEHRDSLSKVERDSLDRCIGRAYLAGGQLTKAVELYKRLADEAPKDAARQRDIALQLEATDHRECLLLARQCWRRIESLTKPGSPEWLTARLGVISTSSKVDREDEARKLLVITKLLYPALGGSELQPQFAELERQLGPGRPKADAPP